MHAHRLVALLSLVSAAALAAPHPDAKDCKDSPLFTRMPDSYLYTCKTKSFDAFEFLTGPKKTDRQKVEGRLESLTYYPDPAVKEKPSELQIIRNFENAIAKAGGRTVYVEKARATFLLNEGGKELWVHVWAEFTGKYGFTTIEREAMKQDIVADAAAFADGLKSAGHASVYGILFDTGKAELKPESAKAIEEVAKLLKGDAALSLYVVGHTDLVGDAGANLKLSSARADAVVQELVKKHGIAAARLAPFGAGPYAPVASNDSEEGRAKNRRVELVKR